MEDVWQGLVLEEIDCFCYPSDKDLNSVLAAKHGLPMCQRAKI